MMMKWIESKVTNLVYSMLFIVVNLSCTHLSIYNTKNNKRPGQRQKRMLNKITGGGGHGLLYVYAY